MRKIFCSLATLFFLAVGSPQALSSQEVSVWVDKDYYPYTFDKGNGAEGVYVNIIEEAFKKIDGFTLKWMTGTWNDGVAALQNGDVMGLVPPYYRPEQRPWLKPYSVPILDEVVSVVCNKAAIKDKTLRKFPDDYKGLRFANNTGFASGGAEFTALVKAGEIEMIEAPDTTTNLTRMVNGEVDCYINDRLVIAMHLKTMAGSLGKIRIPGRVNTEQGYMGFAEGNGKYPHTQAFLAKFNPVIEEMRKSGRIDQIIEEFKKSK